MSRRGFSTRVHRSRRNESVNAILCIAQHVQQVKMPWLIVMIDHDLGCERVGGGNLPRENPE